MSQSASFYSLNENEFRSLNPNGLYILSISSDYITLDGNHEGLQYILSKVRPESADIINEIFYPTTFIGNDAESDIDFDMDNLPVYYLEPHKIRFLSQILLTISENEIIEVYNPSELNSQDIYPSVWNRSSDQMTAFSEKHLEEGFRLLKDFINKAASESSYILIFIG